MGGIYPSPTIAGSRSPAMVVASYAVLIFYGKNKYKNQAQKIYKAVSDIKSELSGVCKEYNLSIIGDPQVTKDYMIIINRFVQLRLLETT